MVNLSRIDLATDEDKAYHIDEWAKLFKATTWEEIKKMAAQNEYLEEASKSIFQFNTDEQIRKMCRDRIEYHQDLHNYERFIAEQESIIAEKENLLAEKENTIAEKDNTIADLIAQKNSADNTIAELIAQIEKLTVEKSKP